ncbi:MAG: sulfurtransferase-like selenium metabolism protein YedF [Clostridia bacterium]|nr:sulfurtransferase-like selenium metabolism protein YedF [Clostridia bacterium]
MSSILVNAMGDQCPIPVVKTMKAIAAMTESGTLEIHVDYEVPVQNLTRFAKDRGLPVSSEKIDDKHYVVRMEVADPKAASAKEEQPGCIPDLRGDTVIAIASECTGNGADDLGATLMKGFLYAVSQQEELPRTILFYNSGAKLTAEGAATIEDLKSMEAQGVEILTCGTCANFFGLEGKQAVGSITNMYVIVEKLTSAAKVIRP